MCGVVGYYPLNVPTLSTLVMTFGDLLEQSSIRGLHAFGICQDGPPLRSFNINHVISAFDPRVPGIAHCRYCTSGDWRVLENNQPLVLDDMVLAFNGVIDMGTREEMAERWGLQINTDNDGEIFLRLLEAGDSPEEALARIKGSFAGCWMTGDEMWAGRNERRPLWKCRHLGAIWYASTRDIFARAGFPKPEPVPVGVEGVEKVSW